MLAADYGHAPEDALDTLCLNAYDKSELLKDIKDGPGPDGRGNDTTFLDIFVGKVKRPAVCY